MGVNPVFHLPSHGGHRRFSQPPLSRIFETAARKLGSLAHMKELSRRN